MDPTDHIVDVKISVRIEKAAAGFYRATSQLAPGLYIAGRTPEECLAQVAPLMADMASMPHKDDLRKSESN